MSDLLLDRIADALAAKDPDQRLDCHDSPYRFARDYVDWPKGEKITKYQADVMRALVREKRAAVRGPHGLGKSALAALLVLWFAVSRDLAGINWKVLTTASAWRQLASYLWPEIHLWARRLRWDKLGREPFDPRTELLNLTLRLSCGQAFAGASDDPALLEGAHADSILVVFDEAKAIPAGTWEALEGALSGHGEALALAVSTPGAPSGVFYDIHAKKVGYEDWWVRHVSLEEAVSAKRIKPSWAAARARQWGEQSAVYQNRVLGEFATGDETGVVPLEWVEASNDRWRAWKDSGESPGPITDLGVDVARSGTDRTALALKHADVVSEVRTFARADTMTTTGYVAGILDATPSIVPVVDVIGVGAGVVDRLREMRFWRTQAFNASAGTSRKDATGELGFANCRSAAWWRVRELLDPSANPTLALPPDDQLIGDLIAPRYSVTSAGRILIESKDDIKKRIGRSTDSGDAVVMACWTAPEPDLLGCYGLAECPVCLSTLDEGVGICTKCGAEREPDMVVTKERKAQESDDNPWMAVYAPPKKDDSIGFLRQLSRTA